LLSLARKPDRLPNTVTCSSSAPRWPSSMINKAGGVNGMLLEGVVYDDACDPKQAVAVANKIVNDEVKFVVGHLCSSSTQPASDIYEDEGILMITAASTSPEITERGYELVFRTIGLDSLQGPTAANFIADHVKPRAVAVIHDKQQYGEGIATMRSSRPWKAKAPKRCRVRRHQCRRQRLLRDDRQAQASQRGLRLLRRLPPRTGPAAASVGRKRPERQASWALKA
jgi:hypothetical protein